MHPAPSNKVVETNPKSAQSPVPRLAVSEVFLQATVSWLVWSPRQCFILVYKCYCMVVSVVPLDILIVLYTMKAASSLWWWYYFCASVLLCSALRVWLLETSRSWVLIAEHSSHSYMFLGHKFVSQGVFTFMFISVVGTNKQDSTYRHWNYHKHGVTPPSVPHLYT